MQKPAVNQLLTSRQLKKADDFAQHQGGPRAGSWVLVWVSLTQMCGGQPHPVGIQPFLFRPSPKWSSGSEGKHLGHGPASPYQQTLVRQQGLERVREVLQYCSLVLTPPKALYRSLPTAIWGQRSKLSSWGQEDATMHGRKLTPSNTTCPHRLVEEQGPCQTAARLYPHNPHDTCECRHHARLSVRW